MSPSIVRYERFKARKACVSLRRLSVFSIPCRPICFRRGSPHSLVPPVMAEVWDQTLAIYSLKPFSQLADAKRCAAPRIGLSSAPSSLPPLLFQSLFWSMTGADSSPRCPAEKQLTDPAEAGTGTAARIACRCADWDLWEAMIIKEHTVHNKSSGASLY